MKRSYMYTAFAAAVILALPTVSQAQVKPSPGQAQSALLDPAIRARILAQIRGSGKSMTQIRTQLQSMGYSDEVIAQLVGMSGADTTALSEDVFRAVRSLGIMDSTALDSLRTPVRERRRNKAIADTALMDSLSRAIQNDTIRAAIQRLLSSPIARRKEADSGFVLFGRDLFSSTTKQFDPSVNGPLPPDYRIGAGDQFTLVLTGDVERTEELSVTRDGWVVLRDAGQIPAANLTFDQLRATVGQRLARVYSGIGAGSARFSILPTRIGTNQVFVLGDVVAPNAYQVSRLGTVLTALYAAGGPNESGDARAVDVKRSNRVVATIDLYDYLLTGSSTSDIRLENGDVVFVRPRGPRVRVSGAVVRPATYELKAGESLADAIRMAGGFRPEADQRRVQIDRIVPPAQRGESGSDHAVLDVPAALMANQKLEAGDVIGVLTVAPRVVNRVEVLGNVWAPSRVAYAPEMRLSQAISAAGGLKPDTYLGAVQISRLNPDSTRRMLRVELHADGLPVNDLDLAPNDIVTTYSITEFRTARYVTISGAVKKPTTVPFQEGMTMRDAILLAGGLDESALLTYAEIARLPESRANGVTATTMKAPLDSSYLFERTADGRYLGPPGLQAPAVRAPEVPLSPYDAISVLRQPDFAYQRTVSVYGRVKFAGTYSLKTKTERISDVMARAGGLTADADSAAIVFIRKRDSTGRVGIDLPKLLKNPKHLDNLILVDGDSLYVPAYNGIVMVRGAVNSTEGGPKQSGSSGIGVAYVVGADIDYYIQSAGGGTTKADAGKAYVLQPNGKIETRRRRAGFYRASPKPLAGSVVQVPERDPLDKRNYGVVAQAVVNGITATVTLLVLIKQLK